MVTHGLLSFVNIAMSGGGEQGGSGLISMVVMMGIIFGIFYFLVIRPQKQQQEEHQSMIESLQEGDEVVTAGGIHGEITRVSDDTLELRVNDDTVLTLNKSGISTRKGDTGDDE